MRESHELAAGRKNNGREGEHACEDAVPGHPQNVVACDVPASPNRGPLGPETKNPCSVQGFSEWAILDSNQGPPPYQSGALTN